MTSSAPTRRLAAALGTAAIAAAALMLPATAANAADLDCASGWQVAPTSNGITVYALDGRTPLGALSAPVCAATGQATAAPVINTAAPSFEVEFKGQQALVEDLNVASFPAVAPESLDEFWAIPLQTEMPGGWMDKLGSASSGVFAVPATGGPFSDGPLETGIAEGTVFRSSGDPALGTVGQSALAGTVSWQPVEYASAPNGVGWVASEYLVPLPGTDDRMSEVEISTSGYTLWSNPTDTSAKRTVEAGETFVATRAVAGWALTDNGEWLKAPANAAVANEESAGSDKWDAAKEKAKDAWSATKEKASDLAGSASDKVAEKKASSKTLSTPAMILSTVLSAVALIFAIAGVATKRARGIFAATPAGIAKTAVALGAPPASFALALAAAATAPFAWPHAPALAGAAGLLAAISLFVLGSRVRGGQFLTHGYQRAIGLRSPLTIGATALAAVASFGGLISVGATTAWLAYLVAAVGSAAVFAGLAFFGPRDREDGPEVEAVTPTDPTPTAQPAPDPRAEQPVDPALETAQTDVPAGADRQ